MPRKSSGRTGRHSSVRPSSRSTGSRSTRSKNSSKSRESRRSSENRKVLMMPKREHAEASEPPSSRSKSAQSHPLTDHEEIRLWAEERRARPTCVRGTGGGEDVGMIRLDFPGYSGEQPLEEISWDNWFRKFDESGLALLVQERTAQGHKSNFNKLVKREAAGQKKSQSRTAKARRRAS